MELSGSIFYFVFWHYFFSASYEVLLKIVL
jgi:hypothetical protein